MKKLLIATTALVGTASVAAADITFSGYGRWGILYEDDRDDGASEEIRLESRYRLNIDSSTETDGGIRFAARIRVQADDNSDGSVDAGSFGGARFQANVGGLRVRVGNVSGVHDAAEVIDFFGYEPGLVGQVGQYSTFGAANIDAFVSSSPSGAEGNGGANGVNIKYEYGDFAVMASYSDDIDENDGYTTDSTSCGAPSVVLVTTGTPAATFSATGTVTDPSSCDDDFEAWEIGASYTFSGWTIGVAYASAESSGFDHEYYSGTLSGSVGIADISVFIGDTSGVDDDDIAYGISGSVPVGAATNIVASYAGGGRDGIDDAFGIGFSHSLGGGVSLSGMVGRNTAKNTVADLGVRFNF